MLKNRQVILAKTEVTYGTDPTPSPASDAILVENLSHSFDGARRAERPVVRASLAPLKSLFAGSLMQVTFDCEVKGSGAAGTPPEIGALLQACAMLETIVAVTSVTYVPASTGHKSVTIYLYEDGLRYILTGCRGQVKASLQTGGVMKLSFTFKGHFAGPTDVALPAPTYDAVVPVPLIGVPFSVDSFSAVISKLDFDLGNTLATPDNIAAPDGYANVQITKRGVTGSFDPEATLVAAYDWVTKWKTSAGMSLTTGVIGSVAGNRVAVTLPAITYTELAPGDRDGVLTREVSFLGAESGTDDDVSIVFT